MTINLTPLASSNFLSISSSSFLASLVSSLDKHDWSKGCFWTNLHGHRIEQHCTLVLYTYVHNHHLLCSTPVFVYLRGEHCLNAGRTLSTCGEKGFPFVQQPPVTRISLVIRPASANSRQGNITPLNPVDQSQGTKLIIDKQTDKQTSRLVDKALPCENKILRKKNPNQKDSLQYLFFPCHH